MPTVNYHTRFVNIDSSWTFSSLKPGAREAILNGFKWQMAETYLLIIKSHRGRQAFSKTNFTSISDMPITIHIVKLQYYIYCNLIIYLYTIVIIYILISIIPASGKSTSLLRAFFKTDRCKQQRCKNSYFVHSSNLCVW